MKTEDTVTVRGINGGWVLGYGLRRSRLFLTLGTAIRVAKGRAERRVIVLGRGVLPGRHCTQASFRPAAGGPG